MSKLQRRLAILFALGIFGLALWQAEPFSPRFQGRTAKQWLQFYTRARQLPERAVVARFGERAIPMLVVESRPSGLYSLSLALEKIVRSSLFEEWRADDFDRRLACHDWAQMLNQVQPDAFPRALTRNRDAKLGLELTRLFYGDRHAAGALKELAIQTTNGALQSRAEELLEAYRALN